MREWLLLVVALIFLLAGVMLQKTGIFSSQDKVSIVASDCDLRSGLCSVMLDDQTLQFRIEPKDIQVLKNLQISLKLPENAAIFPESVSVEFEGINMDMGYNRIFLEPQGQNLFKGSGMIPACTSDTMDWLVHLKLSLPGRLSDVQFRLTTKNR